MPGRGTDELLSRSSPLPVRPGRLGEARWGRAGLFRFTRTAGGRRAAPGLAARHRAGEPTLCMPRGPEMVRRQTAAVQLE